MATLLNKRKELEEDLTFKDRKLQREESLKQENQDLIANAQTIIRGKTEELELFRTNSFELQELEDLRKSFKE